MVISDVNNAVDVAQFSERHVCFSFLGLLLSVRALVVFRKVLGEVDTLLEPFVAAPCHRYLVEIFKKWNESHEIGVFQKLLLHKIDGYQNVLVIVPFEKPVFLLGQGFTAQSGLLTARFRSVCAQFIYWLVRFLAVDVAELIGRQKGTFTFIQLFKSRIWNFRENR